VLVSGATAVFVYGLAEVGQTGTLPSGKLVIAPVIGLLLVALFAAYAVRAERPTIDVRLFAHFAAAAAANLVLGAGFLASRSCCRSTFSSSAGAARSRRGCCSSRREWGPRCRARRDDLSVGGRRLESVSGQDLGLPRPGGR
jgi:hypothetical protein